MYWRNLWVQGTCLIILAWSKYQRICKNIPFCSKKLIRFCVALIAEIGKSVDKLDSLSLRNDGPMIICLLSQMKIDSLFVLRLEWRSVKLVANGDKTSRKSKKIWFNRSQPWQYDFRKLSLGGGNLQLGPQKPIYDV